MGPQLILGQVVLRWYLKHKCFCSFIQANGEQDKPLFDPKLLKDLDFETKHRAKYKPSISAQNPGDMLQLRPLCKADYDKGKKIK